jgi:hypothetical protein
MTGTRTYQIAGIDVITTVTVYPANIDITITVDLSKADTDEPDHSPHQLMHYVLSRLPHYNRAPAHWWYKTHRKITTKTGSQAQRVIKHALAKIDDAVTSAKLDRERRKAEMTIALG